MNEPVYKKIIIRYNGKNKKPILRIRIPTHETCINCGIRFLIDPEIVDYGICNTCLYTNKNRTES